MKRSFLEALENRRSYYRLWDKSPVSDKEIVEMLNKVITHVPSASPETVGHSENGTEENRIAGGYQKHGKKD